MAAWSHKFDTAVLNKGGARLALLQAEHLQFPCVEFVSSCMSSCMSHFPPTIQRRAVNIRLIGESRMPVGGS